MTRLNALLLVSLVGCAAVPTKRPADAPVWRVTASTPTPAADAFAQRLYGGAFEPAALRAEVDQALAASPTSGALHELRGYLAELETDAHGAWLHFLTAAFDTSNPFAAHDLWEAGLEGLTLGEHLANLDALKVLEQRHPDAEVRARATALRASELRLLGKFDAADAELATLGFVDRWRVIGPFDNEEGRGFHAPQPPERAIDLEAAVPGMVLPERWRATSLLDAAGAVPLDALIAPSQEAVAYLLTYLQVGRDQEVELRLTTPAPLVAWVNDAEVAREERIRRGALDNLVVRVKLLAGWNKLLLKSAVKRGSWTVAARLTDLQGAPLQNLLADASPRATPKGAALAQAEPASPSSERASFLRLRQLLRDGDVHQAADKLAALALSQPENPLLRLHAAEALRADAQVEKALDLLSGGIDNRAHPPAELLLARAAIYRERSLMDQAESDLENAAQQSPTSRAPLLALAALLGHRGWQQDRRALLDRVVKGWPDSISARIDLADCLEAQDHLARAESELQTVLKAEPGNGTALARLLSLSEDRLELDAALRYAERLRKLSPASVSDALSRAELLRRQGEFDASEAALEALSAQDPDLAEPYHRRALLAEELGQPQRALALWEKASERAPNESAFAERLEHLKPHEPELLRHYVPTDAQIDAAIQRAPKVERLPGSQLAWILDSEAVQLNADGSSKKYFTGVAIAYTQTGRDRLIQAGLSPRGKTKVLHAYAVQGDGSRQEASSITKSGVRFRKLEVGSIIVLQYVQYAPKLDALPGEYYESVLLSSFDGQEESLDYTLLVPRGRAITVEASPLAKRTDSQDGDWDVRRFEVAKVPVEVSELAMEPGVDRLPHVIVSTLPDWEKYIAWEKAILLDSFQPEPQIRALALRLTADAKSPQEKLDRLFRFVAQEIRYQQEYESILAGWQPHATSVVLERKYGDCKDKATLLIALAREVGIEGQFAVLATHHLGRMPRSVVTPFFNHAIAYVPEQPGLAAQFVDTTVDDLDIGNLRDDDQGAQSLVLDPKSGAFRFIDIPFQPPRFQREQHQISLTLSSPTAAHATDKMTLRGASAASIRKTLRNEVQAQKAYAQYSSYIFPRSTLLHASAREPEVIEHPLEIELESDLSHSIQSEGATFRLKLPMLFHLPALVSLGARKTSLDLRVPSESLLELDAKLESGLRLRTLPPAVHVESGCFEVTREVHETAAGLRVSDRFEKRCTEVAPVDYAAFRADVERAFGQLDQALVFESRAQR